MSFDDNAEQVRAQGWRTVTAFHTLVESTIEAALREAADLSVVEYTVLDVLSRQEGAAHHMRMSQVGRATALSSSAATRLVNRLEDRGLLTRVLCKDDRRGIYTELTAAGAALLEKTRPTYDSALERALASAGAVPELAPLVRVFESLPA